MGSGKLREGMINQHSMFFLGFLDFCGGEGENRDGERDGGEGGRRRRGEGKGAQCLHPTVSLESATRNSETILTFVPQ